MQTPPEPPVDPDALTVELRTTRKLRSRSGMEDTLILASLSGITPLPVHTQEMMINAVWFKNLYAWLDRVSGGKAAKIVPVLSFLVIGGSASVMNLIIVFTCDFLDRAHHNELLHNLIYSAIGTEISLIYNFMLNDRFTFRALVDGRRSWLQRCIRFHGPASVGFTLTLLLYSLFFTITKPLPAHYHHSVISQAMAIIIVTAVNFLMHRFWTYRSATPATA
jgi:putative flippase GtrA